MLKNLLRPAMIFIPFVLGGIFPEVSRFSFLIRWILIVMFFMICLQIKVSNLKPQKWHWLLLLENIAIGLGGYYLFHLTGHENLALAAFFVGITPTANAAPVVMAFLNGRVAYVVSGFVVTNLGVSAALVILLPLVTGNYSFGFVRDIVISLLQIIGIPFAAAFVTRKLYPDAKKWPGKCKMFSLFLWSCTLFIIAGVACSFLRSNPQVSKFVIVEIALISMVICILNFWLGGRLVPHRLKRESSQLLGQKNTTFTLFLALVFANPLVAMGPVFYVFWHNLWNALQMFRYDRHRNQRFLPIHEKIQIRFSRQRRKRLRMLKDSRRERALNPSR